MEKNKINTNNIVLGKRKLKGPDMKTCKISEEYAKSGLQTCALPQQVCLLRW